MEPAEKESAKKTQAEPPSAEKLKKASEHLHYEIWMFASMAQALPGAQQAVDAAQIRVNAFLEAFVIHARVLMDFMYDDKPWADDVVATNFFDTPEQWTDARKPLEKLSEELQKVNGRAGKEVAHLTFARQEITAEMKTWQYGKIAEELAALFNDFLARVPKEHLGPLLLRSAEAVLITGKEEK